MKKIAIFLILYLSHFLNANSQDTSGINNVDDKILKHNITIELENIKASRDMLKQLCVRYGSDCENKISQQQLTEEKISDMLQYFLRREKRLMELNLSIQKEKDGTNNSILLLFGHYIAPPYNITYNPTNYYLALNGVDLWPYALTEAENKVYDTEHNIYFIQKVINYYMLEISERNYIKYKIKDINHYWLYLWNKQKIIDIKNELKTYLEEMKKSVFIKDYFIYDEKNQLFDMKGFYTDIYFNIPKEFKEIILNEHKLNTEKTDMVEYIKSFSNDKYSLDRLEQRYRKFENILNTNNLDNITIISITGNVVTIPMQEYKKIVLIMQSDGFNYQKIQLIERILGKDKWYIVKELFYNYDEKEYCDLLLKINSIQKEN